MSRIFITGSADGRGQIVAKLLIADGHQVVLHARNEQRARDAKSAMPRAEAVVVGDLMTIAATKEVASKVNELGDFDAIIHNAAVGYQEPQRINTADNLPHVFAVNLDERTSTCWCKVAQPDGASAPPPASGQPVHNTSGCPHLATPWKSVAWRVPTSQPCFLLSG